MFRYSLFLLAAFTSLSMMASAQSFNVHLDVGNRGGVGHYHGNQSCRSNSCGYQVNRGYQTYRPVARQYGQRYDRRYDRRYRKNRKHVRRNNRRYGNGNNYRCY